MIGWDGEGPVKGESIPRLHEHAWAGLMAGLATPYLAVGIFWFFAPNAWLAILSYHLLILIQAAGAVPRLGPPARRSLILLALPTLFAGPLLYLLMPHILQADLATWLADYRLSSGYGFLFMIPYFGLVHPWLEQVHWHRLREQTRWAHPAFAGYHLLVLGRLLSPGWLLACFALLSAGSIFWLLLSRRSGSLFVAILSHILADTGIIVAAWLRL